MKKMKYIKLYEAFVNVNQSLKNSLELLGYNVEIQEYKELGFYLYDKNTNELIIDISIIKFGEYDYSHILEIFGKEIHGNLITVNTVNISKKHRRKGLYKKLINNILKWSNENGFNGLISSEFNIDTEFRRSEKATSFWEKQFKTNSKVSKILYNDVDENDNPIIAVDYILQ